MKRPQFQSLIHRILKEEIEKKSSTDKTIYQRVPEVAKGEDLKKVIPHTRETKSKHELIDDIAKVVAEINKDFNVYWDDHDDIMISGRDMFRIRVIPKWENNFSIEAFTRNEDRIFIVGQSWDQVKQFVKINLKDATSSTEKAYSKVVKNREDNTKASDKGMPQKDKPQTLPLTNEPPKETKNKDKNFTQKQVEKDDDLPDKPLKEVGDFKRQDSHKVQNPEKLRKEKTKFPEKKPNTVLKLKL